jgi:hypothetical protein
MAVMDRIPVTRPSRGTAINHVNIAIAILLSYSPEGAPGRLEIRKPVFKPELYSQILRRQ